MGKKLTIPIKLPLSIPDRCIECPLLGIIPINQRKERKQSVFLCIPTRAAMSQRFISSRLSEHDNRHPMHKPCEELFNLWAISGKGQYNLAKTDYVTYRLPYEQRSQREIDFDWNKR